MKANMEVVRLTADVVTTSTTGGDCECFVMGSVSLNMQEDDC